MVFCLLFSGFIVLGLTDLYHLLSGLILVSFSRLRRLGIRNMVMSVFGTKLAPRYCNSPCDGSCGNWTCPCYHSGRETDF